MWYFYKCVVLLQNHENLMWYFYKCVVLLQNHENLKTHQTTTNTDLNVFYNVEILPIYLEI